MKSMIKNSSLYFGSLFFFKLCVGAILLLVGWDSLTLTRNGLLNITITMALSFFPAAFARPLFNRFSQVYIPTLLSYCLVFSAILILCEYFLVRHNLLIFFCIHFILWIFIFIIEVSCEKWYVSLAQNLELANTRKLSGVSTGIAQIGVILGPVLVILARSEDKVLPYILICISFLIALMFCLWALWKSNEFLTPENSNVFSTSTTASENKGDIFWYVLAFALIWPTLVIFNISIPVLAYSGVYKTINVAGLLEVLIGFGTATAGFTHHYLVKIYTKRTRNFSVVFLLFISTIVSYSMRSYLLLIAISIFLLGLTFGYLRVELRTQLSIKFNPKQAGELIAKANSWSGPLVIFYSACFYLEINSFFQQGLTFLFPLSFMSCALVFLYVLSKNKIQGE